MNINTEEEMEQKLRKFYLLNINHTNQPFLSLLFERKGEKRRNEKLYHFYILISVWEEVKKYLYLVD